MTIVTAKTGNAPRWLRAGTGLLLVCAVVATLPVASATRMEIGSRVSASAEPPVSRPSTQPCTVTLLSHEAFDDHGNAAAMAARPHPFRFVPPAGCRGSWSKVVLEIDFSVPAGRQFDRTATLWLGGVNLYFGTTLEPEPDVAQHWHVQRDLTDYASLFRHAQPGQMILNNWISPTTNQPIQAEVRVLFYPASAAQPAAVSADRVYPLSSDPRGEQTPLENQNQALSRRITFPRNVERAYLDVIAQSQSRDERWYTCVDQRYLEKTRAYSLESFEACDGGGFRGVEVLVDGRPAGLAPVYPWIYTGGVAPRLWLPTPGIQTVNFIPARVDLTPFVGLFDDGKPHTVEVRVLGADHFFNVAANLLIHQDPRAGVLEGGITQNTLAARQPAGLKVRDTLHHDASGRIVGAIDTDQQQSYVIAGRLHTPRGIMETRVRYAGGFHNHQTFARPGSKLYIETIDQLGTLSLTVERTLDGRRVSEHVVKQRDPLHLSVHKKMRTQVRDFKIRAAAQDFTARVAMRQGHRIETRRTSATGAAYHALLDENLSTRERADGNTIPDPLDRGTFAYDEAGSEQVSFSDSLGSCYRVAIRSRKQRLAAVSEGNGCSGNVNHLDSHSRPDHPWLAPLGHAQANRESGDGSPAANGSAGL